MRTAPLLTALWMLSACTVQTVEEPPRHGGEIVVRIPDRPAPGAEPSERVVVDRIDFDSSREGQFLGSGAASGYVVAATGGALFTAQLDTPAAAEVLVFGPLVGDDWNTANLLARGRAGAELTATAPADGSYLVAAFDPTGSGGAYALTLRCASAECRVECGPDGACPNGAQCAFVQCIRAPCPSYCRAMPPLPPGQSPPVVPSPVDGGGVGATCGTRGAGPCAAGLFCRHDEAAQCGATDAPGTCEEPPQICTREYAPVCGCDGRTYGNRCGAWAAGVSVQRTGECPR